MALRSPLFDYYDPYGTLQEQAQLGMLPNADGEYERRQANIADLLPEEEKQGLLQGLANATTSGLTGLGWILDTPGAMVRGTVSGVMDGDPLKGVRALWETSDDRVDGRELFRQMGVIGDEDTWGNWLGGLAGEIALDPLTYLNPLSMLGRGAATTAGRGLSRAGLLDDVALRARKAGMGPREYLLNNTPRQITADIGGTASEDFSRAMRGKSLAADDYLDQPAAALMEFRVPGMETGTPISLGKTADTGIARFFDNAGQGLATNPITGPAVGRLTASFDPSVLGRTNYDEQWRAREAFTEANAGERDFRGTLARKLLDVQKARPDFLQDQRIQNAIADSIENIDPVRLEQLAPESLSAIKELEADPALREFRDYVRSDIYSRQEKLAALGVKTPMLSGDLGFLPRQQVQFARPRKEVSPGAVARRVQPYERGDRLFTIDDVVGKSRRDYLQNISREQMRRLMAGDQGRDLYGRLFQATEEQIPDILDSASSKIGVTLPYDSMRTGDGQTMESLRAFLADPALTAAERAGPQAALQELERQSRRMKVQLGELLRTSDRNFADKGIGLFDRPITDDILRYGAGTVRSEANAKVVSEALINARSDIPASQMPGGGYTNLLEAASGLGFDRDALGEILAARLKDEDVASLSVPDSVIEQLKAIAPLSSSPQRGALGKTWDSYTNLFKVLALAKPSYHTRNLYSGFLSSLTAGGMNPANLARSAYAGFQAGKGEYAPMVARLKTSPVFQGMSDQEIIDNFLVGGARNQLGLGLASDAAGDIANTSDNLLIGKDVQRKEIPYFGEGGLLYDPSRSWSDWLTVRGVDRPGATRPAPAQTLNPLIDLHERTGRRVEDALRIGTYIESLRQGMSPDAAAAQVFKTQVDYSPKAFTDFERQIKRVVPFYSYTRGIAPLVAENLLYRPGGLQGQVTRAVSAAARPGEDSFTPEDLRKSTAIQLPGAFGDEGQLRRYLTNIDLPWRGLVDLISPAVGNNALESFGGTVQRTGLNLLGQTNPLIKGPLEYLTDRQFYSGRDLSDTYSMFEQYLGAAGRPWEQAIMNAPGGSTALGLLRTAVDDRLSPAQKASKVLINNFTGLRVTDRDLDKEEGKAARQVLTELLKATPGVRAYESLSVPEESLEKMSESQRKMYLLYRTIQSDAARRARERQKRALDPLEALGAF